MRVTALLLALLSPAAWAAEESAMNAADVSWMMVATTLVLFMTIPGIALFYAGMVRKKNVLSVVMQSFAICCSITIVWYVCGYSLAFTEGNFFIGGFDKVFLHGIGINTMQGSIPEMLFMMFQMTFAILTPALMCGAFAERMKFSALWCFGPCFATCLSVTGFGVRTAGLLPQVLWTMPAVPLFTSMPVLQV